MNRTMLLFSVLLAACSPYHEPAPTATDLGDPFACANDPRSPCPTGCNCREHDRICVPNPMTPDASCRR